MNAEIIAVGSELLLGQITNTNAQFLSKQLSELGINVFYHTVVGDNASRLKEAIEMAESRADMIIFTGGLGPTKDDLTKHTIATHLKKELTYNEDALIVIQEFFEKVKRPMTDNNRQQALVLEGCKVLTNRQGLAPGMYIENDTHTYLLFPGPPKELQPMFLTEARPLLVEKIQGDAKIVSHMLRFYGIGEAELETKVQHLLDAQTNPTLAPLASDGEVAIRITAKASTEQEAWSLIDAKKAEVLAIVGEYCYGVDDESLQSQLVHYLKEQGLTISAAESLTAGLFMSELAEISGASAVLQGGVVTYSNEAKVEQLGIDAELIRTHGVVSKEVAEQMAERVRAKFNTSIGIGLTGVAGPGDQDGIPAGTVWVGFSMEGKAVESKLLRLHGSRNTNRIRTVKYACSHVLKYVKKR